MPPHARRRSLVYAGSILLTILLLAGAVIAALMFLPPRSEPTPTPTPTPAPTSTEAGDEVRARIVERPAPLADDAVAGLEPVQESTTDASDQQSVSYAIVPSSPALTALIESVVAERRSAFAEAPPVPDRPRELSVTWLIVHAAGPFFAERVSSARYLGGANGEETSVVFLVDVATGEAKPAAALIAEEARPRIMREIAAALFDAGVLIVPEGAEGNRSAAIASVTADERYLADVVFDAEGALVITLPPAELTPHASGQVSVRIDPDLSVEALSPWGERLREAVRAQEPFVGLPVPPEPEPTTPVAPPAPGGVDCAVTACVALTFDDGPGPDTARLLDILHEADARATFFVVGRNAEARPRLLQRMVAEGHEVGSHSWSHPDLRRLSEAERATELDRTADAIERAGAPRPSLMRPPYGALDDPVRHALATRGEAAILWNVDTEDWKHRDAAEVTRRAIAGATTGSIILLHDIHPTTVDAVPELVRQLRAQGLTPVTVSQLLGTPVQPGRAYYRR